MSSLKGEGLATQPSAKNSFVFNEEEYDVKCVFQIWEKKNIKRNIIKQVKTSKYFDFVKKSDNPDFAIRRVVGLAGKVIEDYEKYKEPSHYYIKSKIDKKILISNLKKCYKELNSQADNSAGNPSLSKHELIVILKNQLKEN